VEGEKYIGISDSDTLELINNMAHFHRIRTQEVSPGRYVKKEIFYR
jgi:hypothetical protein